jgi:hypothetical protein
MSSDDESSFADLFNGLTMGASRARKRQAPQQHHSQPAPEKPPPVEEVPEENAASVRAYAWTAGRTRPSCQLEIETLISTTPRADEVMHTMRSEHQAVARLCRTTKSVAEIGALLSIPLGVTRVLLDDMAGLGFVTVHRNKTGEPDMDLLRRVLRGLTNLRS